MTFCNSQATGGLLCRLAHITDPTSFTLAQSMLAVGGDEAWIGTKTTVVDSLTWSQWHWYDTPTTTSGPISWVAPDSEIDDDEEDCGKLSDEDDGLRDEECTKSSLVNLCEFYCRKYMVVIYFDARMTSLFSLPYKSYIKISCPESEINQHYNQLRMNNKSNGLPCPLI